MIPFFGRKSSKNIRNFWIAYDRIHKSNSYDEQLYIIKSNYLDIAVALLSNKLTILPKIK